MTDEEVLYHYEQMQKLYPELPNPEHEPIQFAYYVKLYNYYHGSIRSSYNSNQP